MKSSEECIGSITFNITQDDVNSFAAIGASFYVSDPMDVVNGGNYILFHPKTLVLQTAHSLSLNILHLVLTTQVVIKIVPLLYPMHRHLKSVCRILTQIFNWQKQNMKNVKMTQMKTKCMICLLTLTCLKMYKISSILLNITVVMKMLFLDNSGDEQENVMPLRS